MPAQSYAPQSIGTRQLNIRKGSFDSIDATLSADTGETIYAGRVAYKKANGTLGLGLVTGALPIFMFTDSTDPVAARSTGMMPGGKLKGFRHNAPVELSTTEFVGLTSAAIDTPLTAVTQPTADSAILAASKGKLRAATTGEPVVGYLTKASYKGAEGQTLIDFVPAYVAGTVA